jgi:hypothetical protein
MSFRGYFQFLEAPFAYKRVRRVLLFLVPVTVSEFQLL